MPRVFTAAVESAAVFGERHKEASSNRSFLSSGGLCGGPSRMRMGLVGKRAGAYGSREQMLQNFIGHIEWHYISPEDEAKGGMEKALRLGCTFKSVHHCHSLLYGEET